MLSRGQNTFHHNPRLRGPVSSIEIKQTATFVMISLEIVETSQGDRTIIVPSPWGYRRMTVRCPYDFMGPAKASCGDLAGSSRQSQESTIIFGPI